MDRTELGKITRIRTGKLDANAADDGGMYPFFTCAEKPLAINTAAYDCECVLVAGNGDLNVKYYKGKFNAYQRTYIVESSDSAQLQVPYLYRFLEHYVHNLRSQSIGGVIKYIRLSNLTDALIPLLSTAEQQQVTDCFDKIDELVSVCQRALDSLDLLVKSRFIEMFGDCSSYASAALADACAVFSDGDWIESKDQSDEGIRLIQTGNIGNGVYLDKSSRAKFVSLKTFKELRCTEVFPGDILISRLPDPVGRCCIVPDGLGRSITAVDCSIVRLSPDWDPVFFRWFTLTDAYQAQIKTYLTGTTRQRISRKNLGKTLIPRVSLEDQRAFSSFANKVDKLRFDVQQQIEKLQTLKKSLMQEYFG